MIAITVNLFRFAPICLRTLGTIRIRVARLLAGCLVAEPRFASNALVVLTTPLATREMFNSPVAIRSNVRTIDGYHSYSLSEHDGQNTW